MTEPLPELQPLFEATGLPRFALPNAIGDAYGAFGLVSPIVYGNFVSSLDGVVALPDLPRSSALISGGDAADRFVVALLRAAAHAIVIGAGTFRSHAGPWTAENAFAEAADDWAELRRREGMADRPTLVVVTSSGDLGGSRSKLDDAIVVTTSEGVGRMGDDASAAAEVVEVGDDGPIDMRHVVNQLAERGYERVLTEGGPKLMGRALEARIVDELFLTISPQIAGGGEGEARPTLASGVELLPDAPLRGRLVSLHRADAYVFLRYALGEHVPFHPESA
jgi:riboflavin biosynthesis pyrimidine reductase